MDCWLQSNMNDPFWAFGRLRKDFINHALSVTPLSLQMTSRPFMTESSKNEMIKGRFEHSLYKMNPSIRQRSNLIVLWLLKCVFVVSASSFVRDSSLKLNLSGRNVWELCSGGWGQRRRAAVTSVLERGAAALNYFCHSCCVCTSSAFKRCFTETHFLGHRRAKSFCVSFETPHNLPSEAFPQQIRLPRFMF